MSQRVKSGVQRSSCRACTGNGFFGHLMSEVNPGFEVHKHGEKGNAAGGRSGKED